MTSVVQYGSVGQCESFRGNLEIGSYLKHRFHCAEHLLYSQQATRKLLLSDGDCDAVQGESILYHVD